MPPVVVEAGPVIVLEVVFENAAISPNTAAITISPTIAIFFVDIVLKYLYYDLKAITAITAPNIIITRVAKIGFIVGLLVVVEVCPVVEVVPAHNA